MDPAAHQRQSQQQQLQQSLEQGVLQQGPYSQSQQQNPPSSNKPQHIDIDHSYLQQSPNIAIDEKSQLPPVIPSAPAHARVSHRAAFSQFVGQQQQQHQEKRRQEEHQELSSSQIQVSPAAEALATAAAEKPIARQNGHHRPNGQQNHQPNRRHAVHFSDLLGPFKKILQKHDQQAKVLQKQCSAAVIQLQPPQPPQSPADPSGVESSRRPHNVNTHLEPATGTTGTLREKYGKRTMLLGRGANASCWLVRRPSDDKLFAVKEFKGRRYNESEREWTKRLTSEYCIGSLLHHPNVVETLDLIIEKKTGHAYEVMELCPGGDLFSAITDRDHRLTHEEIDCIFAQLIHGVAYLHASGICHRDLKPENCLFDEKTHLKIIDFGCAEVVQTPFERSARMCKGKCGSEPYMAPEEFTERYYDGKKVDVWACAVIYIAMVWQRFPWQQATVEDKSYAAYANSMTKAVTSRQTLPTSPPSVSCTTTPSKNATFEHRRCQHIDRLPSQGAQALIRKMLEPDPSKRITIAEILDDGWFRSIVVCDDCVVRHQHGRVKGALAPVSPVGGAGTPRSGYLSELATGHVSPKPLVSGGVNGGGGESNMKREVPTTGYFDAWAKANGQDHGSAAGGVSAVGGTRAMDQNGKVEGSPQTPALAALAVKAAGPSHQTALKWRDAPNVSPPTPSPAPASPDGRTGVEDAEIRKESVPPSVVVSSRRAAPS
ncbi:serine/threonine-protein kinase HAL4/sat4 [Quaeritorhiza haematococci]|nr:serine/threonine-protein kinase HAL4/sat4 [Quaeritorhiza haematococci]